jgi:hypothetical protein
LNQLNFGRDNDFTLELQPFTISPVRVLIRDSDNHILPGRSKSLQYSTQPKIVIPGIILRPFSLFWRDREKGNGLAMIPELLYYYSKWLGTDPTKEA